MRGGNGVKLWMKMHDKLSYIEMRKCLQTNNSEDVGRLYYQALSAVSCADAKRVEKFWKITQNELARYADSKNEEVAACSLKFYKIITAYMEKQIKHLRTTELKSADDMFAFQFLEEVVAELQTKMQAIAV